MSECWAVVQRLEPLDELKRLLPQCLLPDQVRIGQRLARWLAAPAHAREGSSPVQEWLAQARSSVQTRQARRGVMRHLSYPPELPIAARREDIVRAIREHPAVIVAGETGSGKTTQLPKMCLEAGLGLRARIGCTQPRRVAAQSISRRVAEELRVEWGQEVGCVIRFEDESSPLTSLKFMTDGILLAEIQSDRWLCEYEALILDEAHERSLNIDFLLGYLRTLLEKRDDLKLIVTSATIDTERFSRAFSGAPVIEVSGRLYPVEVRYAPLDEQAEEAGDLTYVDAAVNAVDALLDERGGGDLLVFMPGERDIRETSDLLRTRHRERLDVIPLFGRLSSEEQRRVFDPGPRRRVVVATNIAETSLTVPRIRYVVDAGLARISRYHPGTRSNRLPVEPVAQSSANQRKGRCGRLADGVCVRLYSEADFLARRPYLEPEIQRSDLADVILRMKAFQLGDIETFPFLDPPAPQAIQAAYVLLQELGALDEQRALTALGSDLARLPVDPAIGRMILEAWQERSMQEVLVIAAGLSIQDPRERPLEKRETADAAHRRFADARSDFLTLLNIWNAFHDTWESLKTQNQLRKFCKAHFLSYLRMREWVDIHAQLEEAVAELGHRLERRRAAAAGAEKPVRAQRRSAFDHGYAAIHRSILSGLLGHVAQREEKNLYRLGGHKQAMLFPGSGLFEKTAPRSREGARPAEARQASHGQPPWIVAGELLETSRLFVRMAAAIDPEWVEELAPHLVRVTHENPRWDRGCGRVLCTEKVLWRGLVLREGAVGYLKVNAADATALFIRAALIEGDMDETAFPFLGHNRQVCEKVEMWQTRLPHRVAPDLEESLFQFYAACLQGVASIPDLHRVIKSEAGRKLLFVTEADLLGSHAPEFDAAGFPDAVTIDGHSVAVAYAYAPGEERDGVTFRLSAPLAERVDVAQLEWAVPALREERIYQLLDRLPKALRRPLMPLNAAAREIGRSVGFQGRSFLADLSRFVQQRFGVEIPVSAWPVDQLPLHLRPRFEIVGKKATPLASGRDLAELRRAVSRHETPDTVRAWEAAVQRGERYSLKSWDFGDLPERQLVSDAGEVALYAHPGLQVEHSEVNLRLFRKPEEALDCTRLAVPRLAERQLEREMGWLQKDLRSLNKQALLHASLGPVEELIETAFECLRRHLLRPPDAVIRSAAQFEGYVAEARRRLPGLASALSDRVASILQKRQEALVCKRPLPKMRAEIDELVPRRFLASIPFEQLAHLPRYLQALTLRAERAALNPVKDADKLRRVQPYLEAVRALRKQAGAEGLNPAAERFRWLVEEFKVSVFAQELGTAAPVSAKRLDEALLALKQGEPKQAH